MPKKNPIARVDIQLGYRYNHPKNTDIIRVEDAGPSLAKGAGALIYLRVGGDYSTPQAGVHMTKAEAETLIAALQAQVDSIVEPTFREWLTDLPIGTQFTFTNSLGERKAVKVDAEQYYNYSGKSLVNFANWRTGNSDVAKGSWRVSD